MLDNVVLIFCEFFLLLVIPRSLKRVATEQSIIARRTIRMEQLGPLESPVSEDFSRVVTFSTDRGSLDHDAIQHVLQNDNIVLIENNSPEQADEIVAKVCERFDLLSKLQVQAGFTSVMDQRKKVEQFYMTVNQREEFEFIQPHSEGMSFMNIQLASFYCYENSTDGGETLLFNVKQNPHIWSNLREEVVKGKVVGPLSPSDIAKARLLYKISMPDDALSPDDKILNEAPSVIPGLEVYTVLTKPKATRSCILDKMLFVNWDSIASVDNSQAESYYQLLRSEQLLRENNNAWDWTTYDNARDRKCWNSEIDMADLYSCKVTYKLKRGDLLLVNNMSWTHAVNNWTPNSGIRRVTAAFA